MTARGRGEGEAPEWPHQFVQRVLTLLAKHDAHGDVFWWTEDTMAPITFLVNCNDLFYWACADCEPLTPENIDELERAYEEVGHMYASELFCARVRKMRPQPPCYKNWPPEIAAKFDACGPVRDPRSCG